MSYVNYYRWFVRGVALVIPWLTLYIARSMFYPYVAGRAFWFYLLVELMVAAWGGLMVVDKRFRPKWNYLNIAMIVFLLVIGLADWLGVNPALSFWSRLERMSGYFNLLHLGAFFFVLSSVFKEKWEWNWLFNSFIVVSFFQIVYAWLQKFGYIEATIGGFRVEGTFGNPTFLAGWLLFTLVLSILFFIRSQKVGRWTYGMMIFLHLITIYLTATRGVMVAIGAGAVLFGILFLLFVRNRERGVELTRKIVWGILILAVLVPGGLWLGRDTSLVKSNETLNRLASISLSDRTTKARFLVWGLAWQGVRERPILGWGQENFLYVFNKYYDPELYDQEQWFDRAHNIVFDWLINGGFLGLLSYLALFLVAGIMLFKKMRKADFQGKTEMLLLGVLLAAYFVQNLFVFDNIGTYMAFMAVLAYISYKSDRLSSELQRGNEKLGIAVTAGLLVLFMFISFGAVFRLMAQAKQVVSSLKLITSTRSVGAQVLDSFMEAANYGTFADGEVREQMGKIVNEVINTENGRLAPKADREAFVKSTLIEMEKESEKDPNNVRTRLFLGTIYTRFSELEGSFVEKGNDHLREALRLSPEKQQAYFALAENYMKQGDGEKAFVLLREAVDLAPGYTVARGNLGFLASLLGRDEVVDEMLLGLKRGDEIAKIGNGYITTQRFSRAIPVYEKAIEAAPENPEYRARLAGLYLNQGRRAEAIEQAKIAKELDPDNYGVSVDEFLKNAGAK